MKLQKGITILFAGRVQGVGFRQATFRYAKNLALAGTVQNLADGRVEVKAYGAQADIDELVSNLKNHFGENIQDVQFAPLSLENAPPNFSIS